MKAFARGIELADAKEPQAKGRRGRVYSPGIGPHGEEDTIDLVTGEIEDGGLMSDPIPEIRTSEPYPDSGEECDLLIKRDDQTLYAEVKCMRRLYDMGKPQDDSLKKITSPYSQDRSALTDIDKLKNSAFGGHKAIIIFGYDYPDEDLTGQYKGTYPLDMMIEQFIKLAGDKLLPEHYRAAFEGLIHPYHKQGVVYGWMLSELGGGPE